ncbi:MAG TPA: hemerythrin domain-containing protein [Dehalococcoidia bacterium]|nr:hemerythrin domain-containing protein [Dehalococcoidia bacterium]
MKRDPSLIRLSRDHNRGLVVAFHIERALPTADDAEIEEMQRVVVDFWEASLLPHFHAECECLLARLVRYTGRSQELVSRTQADHLRVHALVAALRDSDDLADQRRHLSDLATLLRDHIRWEEAVLFEAAQTTLSTTERHALDRDLGARLPEEPPPPPWPR